MLKVNELRIGNWVNVIYDEGNNNSRIEEVVSIGYDIMLPSIYLVNGCESFEHIPITEDWLIKFGFRKMITKENFFIINEDSSDEILYNIFNKDVYTLIQEW